MLEQANRRWIVLVAVLLFASLSPSLSLAQEASAEEGQGSDPESAARAQCFDAHRSAQELKREGEFLEARAHLLICSSAQCPGVIIEDCGAWMADLEQMTPSMVFEVQLDGKDAPLAEIYVDGELVDDKVGGVLVNPGRHTVRAELESFEPQSQTVTLPAGQRMRLIEFSFQSRATDLDIAATTASKNRPTPVAVYPVLGLGVAGLATFGVMAGLGLSEQNKLEESCSPDCSDSDLSKMKTYYLIGDIAAGVGAAALVTAGIIYFTRPTKRERVPQVSITVDPAGGNFGLQATGSF